jgi:hypothetical protein
MRAAGPPPGADVELEREAAGAGADEAGADMGLRREAVLAMDRLAVWAPPPYGKTVYIAN